GIGLALLVTNGLKEAILSIRAKSTGFQIFKYFSLGLFITIIVFSVYRFGSYGRHKQIIEDVKVFSTIVPKNSVVTIPNEMWDEYNFRFQGYLMRYAYISINPYKLYDYCIVEKANNSIPQGYEIIELATQKYDLYKKK
ncbi:MAG: hypothetical protein U9R19_01635, partial [Bacteroidota bacterium]|nr:hypothetical protein [Bacteroidota bacterium]